MITMLNGFTIESEEWKVKSEKWLLKTARGFLPLFSFLFSLFSLLYRLSSVWSVWMDSNHRPRAYQARALTTWATDRSLGFSWFVPFSLLGVGFADWWRWWDSNPWPPACRAGALPTELHPHLFPIGVNAFSRIVSDPQKLNNKSSIQAYAPTHSSFRLIWQIRENLSRSP